MRLSTKHLYPTVLGAYLGLFALLTISIGWLSPPEQLPRAMVLILVVGPLLFPLRGLLHGRPYTFAWSSFMALIYLTLNLTEALANPAERLLSGSAAALAATWFAGAVLYARLRARELSVANE